MLVTAVSLIRAVRPLGRMSCEHSTKKSPAGRCSTFISLVHGSTCVPRPQLNICLLPGSAGNPRQRPNASTASASRLTQRSRMSFVNGEALYVVWSLPEYPVRWAVHQIPWVHAINMGRFVSISMVHKQTSMRMDASTRTGIQWGFNLCPVTAGSSVNAGRALASHLDRLHRRRRATTAPAL